jgi:hypothetical protein
MKRSKRLEEELMKRKDKENPMLCQQGYWDKEWHHNPAYLLIKIEFQ